MPELVTIIAITTTIIKKNYYNELSLIREKRAFVRNVELYFTACITS